MHQCVFNMGKLFPGDDADLRTRFASAVPYPHAVLRDAIAADFARKLFHALETFPYRWRRVRESFYEHEVCNLSQLSAFVGGPLAELLEALQEPSFVDRLCSFVQSPRVGLTGLTGHRLYDGDRIDAHNDDNIAGEVFRLLLFIDPAPKFSGGELVLLEESGSQMLPRRRVPYVPFQAYLFKFGPLSYHAVTTVEARAKDANRLTLLATYGFEAV